jgi:methionyl aminopeptidase
MIRLKTKDEIMRIRESGIILAETLDALKHLIEEGITTKELDDFAFNFISSRGGMPAFLGYYNYPATLCISINNEVIHGIPGKRKLKRGDIVGIDLGVNLKGFFSDACFSCGVGIVSEKAQQLLKTTEECLWLGIEQTIAGNRMNDISGAIYHHAKKFGFDVVRKYCGHGVGFDVHEDPQVFNYINANPNPRIKPGLVIAIEPMVNEGSHDVELLEDDWTVVTSDGLNSAHFEHTIAVFEDHSEVLTLPA